MSEHNERSLSSGGGHHRHGHSHTQQPLLTRAAYDEEFQDAHDEDRRTRHSRNSTGVKEEFMGPRLDAPDEEASALSDDKADDTRMLVTVFIGMVFIGLGNKVFNKLMTIPMYNYPNFLNLLTSFVYIPVCFAYIIPMAKYGHIPQEVSHPLAPPHTTPQHPL